MASNKINIKKLVNKLYDSDLNCSIDGNFKSPNQDSSDTNANIKGEFQNFRNFENKAYDSGKAHNREFMHKFNSITSDNISQNDIIDATESFIPFSQRTSMTHAPTIYEELIQKYEGDIRNHIRIEQQMKLHSDSVISKLEDREKQFDKMMDRMDEQERKFKEEIEHIKIEAKIMREENEALKRALEKKIEKLLDVEGNLKEANYKYSALEKEMLYMQRSMDHDITPRKNFSHNSVQYAKPKLKSYSANPNSGRKTASESMQMFYSRNINVPIPNEEYIIPVSTTRSPQKFTINQGISKNILMSKDGKSPYLQADLEKLKQYINIPKSKIHKRSKSQTIKSNPNNRKAARSALRVDRLNTEENTDNSLGNIQDYDSINNSIVYGGIKKNMLIIKPKIKKVQKKSKLIKNQHFMSYDVRSSLNKYELMNPPNLNQSSMDKGNPNKSKKKMKAKRNSSISKMPHTKHVQPR